MKHTNFIPIDFITHWKDPNIKVALFRKNIQSWLLCCLVFLLTCTANFSFANETSESDKFTTENSTSTTEKILVSFNTSTSREILTGSGVACNSLIQVSLNVNCLAIITPDMILEGVHDDSLKNYIVNITTGDKAGTDTIDLSYLGKTVKIEVVDTSLIPNNKCWGYAKVEDKIPPVLVCKDTTVLCNTSTDPAVIGGQPTVSDACSGNVTFTYADLKSTFNCKPGTGNNPDTISLITRTWQGTDASGNSSTCVQTIHVVKPQLTSSNIIWPKDIIVYCGGNPSTEPEFTGFPMVKYNGDTVSIDQFCLFGMNNIDQKFSTTCTGTRKILRTWTLLDWCHPDTTFTNAIVGPQLIKIQDTIGPVITKLPVPTEIKVSFTDLNSCSATVTVPSVTLDDACAPDSIDIKVQIANTTITTNGGILTNIPFGKQNVIYIATDDCGNITRDTVMITIKDNIAPTVICKENLVISLTQNGLAQVKASIFNNGSYDNCQVDSMGVRRMDSCGTLMTLPFTRYVQFECCDVGEERMVEFAVWDTTGNFNSCMVRVQIQDKVTPVITCPPDVTVTCDTNLTDLSIFGPAIVSGGACNNTKLEVKEKIGLDNCGAGTITRTWSVPNTAAVPCTQTITVSLVPNDSIEITKMPDSILTIECSSGFDIESLSINDLEVKSSGCQLLAVSYDQRIFSTDGECKKILRTWEIIDWCKNPLAHPDSSGYKLVTQIVKVVDSIAPTFINVMDTMIVNTDHSVCNASVTLPAFTAVDSCGVTPKIVINGIFANAGGGYDTLINVAAGTTIIDVKVGTYKVIYTATDGCNNRTSVPLIIIVKDNEGPSIFCDDLVTTLIVKADEADGSVNKGWITVWASDFNCKVSDCDTSKIIQVLRFPSLGIGQNNPPSDTSFGWTFNCSTLQDQIGDLWVRDGSGNWDYVRITVNIQDNGKLCSTSAPSAMISGTIETEEGTKVEEVTVNIGGYTMNPELTGIDGNYQFEELPINNNYVVAPEKKEDPLNGVSTYDLVLISKHILGLASLDSPYKQIAADVNKSGTITAYDLVQLRRLILNINTEFANNTSWRFIDAGYQFTTENPAAESFSETANIGELATNTEAHFIAVKVGDVNKNAIANRGLLNSEDRSTNRTLTFQSEEVTFKEGEIFNAEFTLTDVSLVEGYQFTLDVDPTKVEIVAVNEGIVKESNFGMRLVQRGQLTTSWNQGAQMVRNEERMFGLVLRAKQAGTLSEAISISSDLTIAEAYNTDGELLNVDLIFGGSNATESEFTLFNNKPNPFKEATIISFELPSSGTAKISIFDISGRVMNIINKEFEKGYNEVQIDKTVLRGAGIYFYQLETATNTAKKKMILIE